MTCSVSQWSLIFPENFSPPALKSVYRKFYSCMSAKIRFKTKDPLWEDCFSFLVHNPRRQELEVEVRIHWQRLDSTTNAGIKTAELTDGLVCLPERR